MSRRRERVARVGVLSVVTALALLAAPPLAAGKRNVYVSGGQSDTLSAFDIAADGALTPLAGSPFATGDAPRGVAATPGGRHLYVANQGIPDNFSAFIVGADGGLTPVPGSPFPADGMGPRGVAGTLDGRHLYFSNGASGNVSAFAVGADGALSPVPGSPFAAGTGPYGVAATPDGQYLYVANRDSDNISAFRIAADGALSPVPGSPVATGMRPHGVVLTPDGRHLYVANQQSDNVGAFAIAADGALSPVPGSPFAAGDSPFFAAATPDGRHLYVANEISKNISAFEIGADGGLSQVPGSPFAAGNAPRGVAATPDGRRLYAANAISQDISAFEIGADGALSPVPGSPFAAGVMGPDFQSLAITPNQGPVAAFSATPAPAGSPTAFDGGASSDSDGTVARYDWDFGDGATMPDGGPTPNHAYAVAGTYTATLTVTDNEGCSMAPVFTGQTAHCNAGPPAQVQQAVAIPPDTDPPGLTIAGSKKQPLDSAVEVKARCDEACEASGRGTLIVTTPAKGKGGRLATRAARKRFRLKPDTKELQANMQGTLKLKVSKKARRAGEKALRRDDRVTARIKVSASDAAANKASAKRRVSLQRKRKGR